MEVEKDKEGRYKMSWAYCNKWIKDNKFNTGKASKRALLKNRKLKVIKEWLK